LNAVQLAKSESAKLTAITVSRPFQVYSGESVMGIDTEAAYNDECAQRDQDYLGFVRKAAESAGVPVSGVHVFNAQPYAAIIDAARDNACDVVCMASHGRKGVVGLVLGSETVKVLKIGR